MGVHTSTCEMADMLGRTCLTVNLLKMTRHGAASVSAELTGHLADCQLADWTSRGLENSQTSQLADWTSRGFADAAKRTKTKQAKSLVASVSCPVRDLSSTRVV